jgi:hypothetical protein
MSIRDKVAGELEKLGFIYYCGEKPDECGVSANFSGDRCPYYHINASQIAENMDIDPRNGLAMWKYVDAEIRKINAESKPPSA